MTLKLPLLGTSIGWLFYASVEPEQVSQSSARAYPDDLDRPSATSLALSRREHGLGIEIFQCDGHLELSSWAGPRSKGSNTDLTPGATVESGPGEARKRRPSTVGFYIPTRPLAQEERANHFASYPRAVRRAESSIHGAGAIRPPHNLKNTLKPLDLGHLPPRYFARDARDTPGHSSQDSARARDELPLANRAYSHREQ